MSSSDSQKRHRGTSESESDDDQSHSKKIHTDSTDDKSNARLRALNEREREQEILKQHEEREIRAHREEISRRLLKSKQTDDDEPDQQTKSKSQTYDNDIYAVDDDDDNRPSANRRKQINDSKQKETEHSKSLQALVVERKKKQDEKVKQSQPKSDDSSTSDEESPVKSSKSAKKETLKVNDVYGSDSSTEEDDDDNDTRARRSRSPRDKDKKSQKEESLRKKCTYITSKSQLKSMVLSRFRMEKWCHAPFFAKVAKGAFVRINIGQHNGKPVYRICEVRDVVETAKIYNLGSTRTNRGLRLKHGHNERVFRLEFVSNSEISDAEFQRWREMSIKQGVSLPTLEDLENKIKDINECKQHVYTNRDISKMVEEKNRFRKVPINYAMKKNDLLKEIEIAKDEEDTAREDELRKKLNEIEQHASEINRRRTEKVAVISEINQRNRKSTQQNVESALAREAFEQKNAAPDPFTRRRCAPILVSKAPQTKEELFRKLQEQRAADEETLARKKSEEQRLTTGENKSTSSKPVFPPKRTVTANSLLSTTMHERGSFASMSETNDDLFSSHNFELDLNLKLFSD